MAITKTKTVRRIECQPTVDSWQIVVTYKVVFDDSEDNELPAVSQIQAAFNNGDTISGEPQDVQDVCNALWS